MEVKLYKVKIRRDLAEVKKSAELIDGKTFNFVEGWVMNEEDTSIYIGEKTMIPRDENYPPDAPSWVSSGDLVELK